MEGRDYAVLRHSNNILYWKAVEQQIELMNQSILSEYSGIGVAPLRSDRIDIIDSAVDLGIVVVTLDSDEATAKRSF